MANAEGGTSAVRLAHFSDVHVSAAPLGWRPGDWLGRRLTGWVNSRLLLRGRRFRGADQVVAELTADLARRKPDHVVFTGDATTLGFGSELERAAKLMEVAVRDGRPGLAVPGNHDYYNRVAARSGDFERAFARWQWGEREDEQTYPFAQRVGHLWLVGVNSCSANFWSCDSSGEVDAGQLVRLRRLLGRLAPGPRVIVTHYPVCLATGLPERRWHGLRNAEEVVRVAAEGGVCLWLHGHRHGAYYVCDARAAPFPVVCAGSVTQRGYLGYGEYTIDGRHLSAVRRVFSAQTLRFEDRFAFEIELPG